MAIDTSMLYCFFFFFSSRRRHTSYIGDWSSDVCSSDLSIKCASRAPASIAVHDAAIEAGAREAHLIEEPMAAAIEIGRASCRERGEITVGGRAMKKNDGVRDETS